MSRAQARAGMQTRAGLLSCICDGIAGPPANDNMLRPVGVFQLAAGFAFAVLGQTVASAALPLAGLMLAPREAFATWPFAALMLGNPCLLSRRLPAGCLRPSRRFRAWRLAGPCRA